MDEAFFEESFGYDWSGEESEDDLQFDLLTIWSAAVLNTDWTTETIVSQLNKGNIDLDPKFQRREAWDRVRKSKFIESLILNLPVPPIVLAERQDVRGSFIVIDGKQRLSAIKQFFTLEASEDGFHPLRLHKLDILEMLNSKSFKDLDESGEYYNYVNSLENQTIRTVIIKNWPSEEFLYTVFLRLNTGSLPLSPHELRKALHPGEFMDYADEFSIESQQIQKFLKRNSPDPRMRDLGMVIRFFAFKNFLPEYSGRLKSFFDDTAERLNGQWRTDITMIKRQAQELNHAIDFVYDIFEDNAFKRWEDTVYSRRSNLAIYDVMVYYFSEQSIRESLSDKKNEIEALFKQLCEENNDFLESIETATKHRRLTISKFAIWGEALTNKFGLDINVPQI